MVVLLDSNILIDVLRTRGERKGQLAGLVASGNRLAISAVTLAEIYAGMRDSEQARTEALLAECAIYPVTSSIAMLAGNLKCKSASRGVTIALPDTLIAATAIEHDIPLLTENRKDFPFPELKMFGPF